MIIPGHGKPCNVSIPPTNRNPFKAPEVFLQVLLSETLETWKDFSRFSSAKVAVKAASQMLGHALDMGTCGKCCEE